MKVRILGAHCLESTTTKLTCVLVDDVLALDAGGLTSSLSLEDQQKISAILLTHQHIDHCKDIALIGYYNTLLRSSGQSSSPKRVYSTAGVFANLSGHILNNKVFPDFTQLPAPDSPALQFCPLEPYKVATVEGYSVKTIPMYHSVPAIGYQVTDSDDKSLFFTGDTGPGLADCWPHISPDLLITELSGPDKYTLHMANVGHLTPTLLKQELIMYEQQKGHIPPVILIHLPPALEDEIRDEVAQVAQALEADITLGYEGMEITI